MNALAYLAPSPLPLLHHLRRPGSVRHFLMQIEDPALDLPHVFSRQRGCTLASLPNLNPLGCMSRCSHTAELALEEDGSLPKLARLEPCSHRHMTLLFLLYPDAPVLKLRPAR